MTSPRSSIATQYTRDRTIARTATLDYYENAFSFDGNGEAAYVISHCSGTGLTAYFECTKFPSSISSHASVFHDDGTISIPGELDYTGSWSILGDTLSFGYVYIPTGRAEAEFTGRGVPGAGGYSPYVSPYRVCL